MRAMRKRGNIKFKKIASFINVVGGVPLTRWVTVEVKVVETKISWKCTLDSGADLCVNEGQKVSS